MNLGLILSLNGDSWNVSELSWAIIKVWKWNLQKKIRLAVSLVADRGESQRWSNLFGRYPDEKWYEQWQFQKVEVEQFGDRAFRGW